MNELSQRTYYEIITEVGNLLEEEGMVHGIDREMVHSIQREWMKNLEMLQSEPVINNVDSNDYEIDIENLNGDSEFSEEEKMDILERQIGVYMVCFFTKVTKTKTKWKCNFKNGFINMDNHDIPYSSATGEFLQW